MIKNFILLGHHRSGTSYLLDVIRHHEVVNTINEPFSMHIDIFRKNEEKWKSEDYNEIYLHTDLKEKPYTVDYIHALKKWMYSPINSVQGFKETALFEKYEWLINIINPGITIILVRHPLNVINSVIKRDMQNSWWEYREKLKNYMSEKDVNNIKSDAIASAYLWKFRINSLIDIIENKEIPTYLIRLEDIVDNPINEINKLMEKLDLSMDASQKKFISETSKETRDSTYSNFRTKKDVMDGELSAYSSEEQDIIRKILEKELRYFDYR